MNMKILRKSFAKACQKVRHISVRTTTTTTSTVSPSTSSSSISKSSGYGTCVSSENIYMDDQRFKLASNLFSSQCKFNKQLKQELERYVRPMAALLAEQHFLGIFQNVEKICSISQYMVSLVDENDFYESMVNGVRECVDVLSDAYTTYVNGFGASVQLLEELSIDLSECFDIRRFLALPICNCKKLYQFMCRLEKVDSRVSGLRRAFKLVCELLAEMEVKVESMVQIVPNQSLIRSRKLVNKSRRLLVKKKKSQVNVLPSDFTDYEGNKHYFFYNLKEMSNNQKAKKREKN
ncbi:hypothetical protein BpHYR1_027128 [Brachionus plicatilis]|uniref:Uncharacterized protein n=1 Tax=Brachionus plicatilis TaxID=10195 RepID=A0A3M7QF98_BRAPC|nr:hypothetical protein BpHYR1_027128 [Brachionus plicatilis]